VEEINIKPEKLIKLKWIGPFSYGPNGLIKSATDPFGPSQKQLNAYYDHGGLYSVIADHPVHGLRSLIYIGQTNSFSRRLEDEHIWLCEEWRTDIYLTKLEREKIRDDVEKLLIYVHSPAYNSKNISNPPKLKIRYRILNEGRFWKLYPDISSQHDWCLPY